MVAYTKPQQGKKEESERLRGERHQIKFIDLGFVPCINLFSFSCFLPTNLLEAYLVH